MMHVGIVDPEDLNIIVRVSGAYNPDVLDDMKRRALDMYRETLAFRQALEEPASEVQE